ncbi:CGNR zinc finger domain-containing protein [Nonomuraea terrae]|uniref:CGNR zinc finger domain-containing protein n=1 Tax=Nonomuraea terrae TaxID=2530383 RepID=A0A4R4ZF41_9ACTN|nr:CGNR zinc finger domain-containing protein [Nonomuraea terrae]
MLTECLNAQQDGTWRRLKICPNPRCVATFYDRTRNNNGVWHSTRSCGNPANLRASRARRRESTQ